MRKDESVGSEMMCAHGTLEGTAPAPSDALGVARGQECFDMADLASCKFTSSLQASVPARPG